MSYTFVIFIFFYFLIAKTADQTVKKIYTVYRNDAIAEITVYV